MRQSLQYLETEKGKTDCKCHSELGDQIYQHLSNSDRQQKSRAMMGEGVHLFKNNSEDTEKADVPRSPLPVYWVRVCTGVTEALLLVPLWPSCSHTGLSESR